MIDIQNHISTSKNWLALSYSKAHFRSLILLGIVITAFLIVALRVTSLSLIGSNIKNKSFVNNSPSSYAPRAEITDRNGAIVATSLKMPILYIDPKIAVSPKEIIDKLSRVIPINKEKIIKKIQKGGRYVAIYHGLTPKQQQIINDFGYPSLGFKKSFRRIYPEKNLLSHIVGYTDIDGIGISGIEKKFNEELLNEKNVTLTIDARIQHIVRYEVQKTIDHFEAIGGSGIVMDINSGEILAMVSLPDFDPHNPQAASDDTLFNRNSMGVYEMGSTFKIFSIAAALEYGVVKKDDKFDVSQDFKINSYTIKDFHKEKKPLSLSEVFTHSSNIGTALVAEKLGTEKLKEFYQKLGLFSPLRIDLPEKTRPLLPKKWRDVNTITAAYGHGIAVTPLHLVTAAAIIVNGGKEIKPHIILKKNKKTTENPKEKIIVSKRTSKIMSEFLRKVVNEKKGTGKKAFVLGYDVGGKTGTSEKIKTGNKKYDEKTLFSSFLAVFPIYNPKYIVLITIDEPKGQKDTYNFATGGWTAAPTAGRIISKIAPLMGLSPRGVE